jgi:D-glycero-alpha-D-manno-heptose-7-phosphate kinase
VIVRARAPLRISFCGGGTDVPPYCDERGGAVLSATVNRYAAATIIPGGDRFSVRSLDYDATIDFGIDEPVVFDGQLDLAKGVLRYFREATTVAAGFELVVHNDAPPGSGLGSSSAITVALIRAFMEHLRFPLDSYQIAQLAWKIERIDVGVKGGKQDQYAAAFGGFNYIEFHRDGTTVVNALRLQPEVVFELEYSLVFVYVGGVRFSERIIERQMNNYAAGATESVQAMDTLKDLTAQMKRALLLGNLREFGALLDSAWQSKRKMAEGIATEHIDTVYAEARKAGALGGKLSGAGGGGFMFFLCEPNCRFKVQDAVRKLGGQLIPFSFVEAGVQAWSLPG